MPEIVYKSLFVAELKKGLSPKAAGRSVFAIVEREHRRLILRLSEVKSECVKPYVAHVDGLKRQCARLSVHAGKMMQKLSKRTRKSKVASAKAKSEIVRLTSQLEKKEPQRDEKIEHLLFGRYLNLEGVSFDEVCVRDVVGVTLVRGDGCHSDFDILLTSTARRNHRVNLVTKSIVARSKIVSTKVPSLAPKQQSFPIAKTVIEAPRLRAVPVSKPVPPRAVLVPEIIFGSVWYGNFCLPCVGCSDLLGQQSLCKTHLSEARRLFKEHHF